MRRWPSERAWLLLSLESALKREHAQHRLLGSRIQQLEQRGGLVEPRDVRDQRQEVEPPLGDQAHKSRHEPERIPAIFERRADAGDLRADDVDPVMVELL